MVDLSEQACEACRADAPLVSDEELQRLLPAIPDWRVIEVDGVRQLTSSDSGTLRRRWHFPIASATSPKPRIIIRLF